MEVLEDISKDKGRILGIIAFSTGVGAFLVEVLKWSLVETTVGAFMVALLIIYISFLISRSERRQKKTHDAVAEELKQIKSYVSELKNLTIDNQLSNLRIQLTLKTTYQPENHDTILKIAQKYFVDMGGDWVATDEFLAWTHKEKEAGRPVNIPDTIFQAIAKKNRK